MKKTLSFISCVAIVLSIVFAGVGNLFVANNNNVAYASSVTSAVLDLLPVTEDFLLDDNVTSDDTALSNYGFTADQISNFTPYHKDNNSIRLVGRSVKLAMLGESSANKYVSQNIDLSTVVSGKDVSGYDTTKM